MSDDPQDAAPVAGPVEQTSAVEDLSYALLPDDDDDGDGNSDFDGYDPDEDERDAMRAVIRNQREQLEKMAATDVWQRIHELEEALALATGPHCSSCGYAIDPDACHCGTSATHHRAEEHSFVPMGCMCGYPIKPHITEWAALAGRIREQLWRARRQNTAAKDVVEHVRTIVQHWRNQDGFNAELIDALANALDRFDREPTDG